MTSGGKECKFWVGTTCLYTRRGIVEGLCGLASSTPILRFFPSRSPASGSGLDGIFFQQHNLNTIRSIASLGWASRREGKGDSPPPTGISPSLELEHVRQKQITEEPYEESLRIIDSSSAIGPEGLDDNRASNGDKGWEPPSILKQCR